MDWLASEADGPPLLTAKGANLGVQSRRAIRPRILIAICACLQIENAPYVALPASHGKLARVGSPHVILRKEDSMPDGRDIVGLRQRCPWSVESYIVPVRG